MMLIVSEKLLKEKKIVQREKLQRMFLITNKLDD
jgi:hypothetical protein